jgi:hypothetical protein
VAYTYYAAIQARATRQSVSISQKEFEMNERPWVSPVGMPAIRSLLDLTPMPGFPKIAGGYDGVSLGLDITVKNSGHSPARRIGLVANFVQSTDPNVFETQKKLCAQFQEPAPPKGIIFETTLFPGDDHTFQRVVSFRFVSGLRTRDKDHKAIFYGVVVGCIDYQFMFAEGHHQTGFIFDLGKKMPIETDRADFWQNFWVDLDNAPIRPEELMFIPDHMGTGPAN